MGATHLSGIAISPTAAVEVAALTLTEREYSGKTIVLNKADGQTITLPPATGSGAKFPFFVKTTVSADLVIQAANANDIMQGSALVDGTTTTTLFQTAADSDTITMNGSTKGGIAGSQIEVEDVAPNVWRVTGALNGSGAEISPFSAAV